MRLTTGLSARGRVAVTGAAAAAVAVALVAVVATRPSPATDDEAAQRDTRPARVAVAPATTTTLPPTTSPTTTPPTTSAPQPAIATNAVTEPDESAEYDEYSEGYCGCGDEYDEYGEGDCGCGDDGFTGDPEEHFIAVNPLADGRHQVLVTGVDIYAEMVEMIELGDTENVRHLMFVTPGYDLTGVTSEQDALPYWATIAGETVMLLEPVPVLG